DKINEINATHILLALDVCNGGTFDAIKVNTANDIAACRLLAEGEYQKLTMSQLIARSGSCKSRKFIASGGNESVFDGNLGDHSPFAKELIQSLNKGHYNKRIVTFGHLCYNISDITTSKPVFSDFSGESTGSDFLFIPGSIIHDAPLKDHFNPPPVVHGSGFAKAVKVLVMPRQGSDISVAEMLNDPAMRAAVAYLTDVFQNNGVTPVYYDFAAAVNVRDDKQQIVKKSGADIYIEVDLKPGKDGTGANNMSVTLTCVQAVSGQLKYARRYRGPYFFTEDYEQLTEKALEENTDEIISLTLK
ncbi:MAG: DUF6175 family protein, partial [Taibaiella sp.]|nr:DUF6175 family protein [Taibaiella sp.]